MTEQIKTKVTEQIKTKWTSIDAQKIATQCSPKHIQSVIEDAQNDIDNLVKSLAIILEKIEHISGAGMMSMMVAQSAIDQMKETNERAN